MIDINSFLSRIVTASKKGIGVARSSWKEWLLPSHRQQKNAKKHFTPPPSNPVQERKDREIKARYDPQGNPITWKTESNIPVGHPDLSHTRGKIPNSVKHHATDRHPECFPKDPVDAFKKPDRVTMHYESGRTDDISKLRVVFHKDIGRYKDGTKFSMSMPTKPIADDHGTIHHHARTYYSSNGSLKPNDTEINVGKIHEAAHYNRDARKKRNNT